MRKKVQTISVSLRFDKPVTKTEAKILFRDCIHGEFYPCELDSLMGAETMKIVKAK